MSNKKALVIKLEQGDEGKFSRDSWFGIGPFSANLNDDGSLSVSIPGEDVQIVTPSSNDFGEYWMVNLGGGKAFASVVNHDTYGTYMRIKLGKDVKLPASVQEKINYKPGAKGNGFKKAVAKKPAGMWS